MVESPPAVVDDAKEPSPLQPTESISTSDVIHHTTSSSSQAIQIPSASTDEDVDELHSHYSEMTDRSRSTPREPLPTRSPSSPAREPPRLFSAEYSQMTLDSGVDIVSEQKVSSPVSLIMDEQSSGETNDLFALSDDSLLEMGSETITMRDNDPTLLADELDLYKGYELETISDDDEGDHTQGEIGKEFLITSERSTTAAAPVAAHPSLPPQFEFKLPSFGEWIDRVFTNFLAETTQQPATPTESNPSSRSSSIVSIPSAQSTVHTSSSSPVITVLENASPMEEQHRPRSHSWTDEGDEHSLNGESTGLCLLTFFETEKPVLWPDEGSPVPDAPMDQQKLVLIVVCLSSPSRHVKFECKQRESGLWYLHYQ